MFPRRLFLTFTALVLAANCEPGVSQPDEQPPESTASSSQPSPSTEPAAPFADAPRRIQTSDSGIFSDLDGDVRVPLAPWLRSARILGVHHSDGVDRYAFVGGRAVGLVPEDWRPAVEVDRWGSADLDGDGIPNQLDIAVGAAKTAMNGADYTSGYESIDYPGGDLPRSRGVCTDVVVRALRNAGIDLQKRLHEDIVDHRGAYPTVETPDPNIDHRRVRTLLPYFRRHWRSLPTDPRDSSRPWLPGDVVFMDTMGGDRPDHVGLVSHREGGSGLPLVVNNWTTGYETSAMDLLDRVPVTHRFRLPAEGPDLPDAQRGLSGLLRRHGAEIPDRTDQVVVVTTPGWNHSSGELRRLERRDGGWSVVSGPHRVRLGSAGVAPGRGIDGPSGSDVTARKDKKEGDRRAPVGIFELGTAFGRETLRPNGSQWPWRSVDRDDRYVDDPDSEHYNEWVRTSEVDERDWDSAERLSQYRLGVVVEHNRAPTRPGAGSAIFLHTAGDTDPPTLGCTALDEEPLRDLVAWLDPSAHPLFVQLPGPFFSDD